MKGTYTIVLACKRSMRIRFGKLGYARPEKGHYLYTGSALGDGAVSLEGRLKRHARLSKSIRWHVDYLTSDSGCKVQAAIYLKSRRRLECSVNRWIFEKLSAFPVLPRLGASDCKCITHLLRADPSLSRPEILDWLNRIYSKFGEPFIISFDTKSRSADLPPIS